MTRDEILAVLNDAQSNKQRVTLTVQDGRVISNVLVYSVEQPVVNQVVMDGHSQECPLPYVARFSTDDPESVAFGIGVRKITEVTVDVP